MTLSLLPILHIVYPNSALSCSKGSRGLFVPLRVPGIFTGTTISPRSRLRQCPDRYTIRAGRNLPDKESSTGQVSGPILLLSNLQSPVFLINSRLDLFAAPTSRWDPLSRSYGVNLPSSLTVTHSSTLGYSPRPPVSVYGTGDIHYNLEDFLGSLLG